MQVECLYEETAMPTWQEMSINQSRKCNLKSFCSEAGTARSQWLLPERPARSGVIGAGWVGGAGWSHAYGFCLPVFDGKGAKAKGSAAGSSVVLEDREVTDTEPASNCLLLCETIL